MIVPKEKFIISICLAVICVAHIVFTLSLRGSLDYEFVMRISTLGAFIIFLLEAYCIKRVESTLFTPIFLFLLSFYLFQNGQLLLKAFSIKFNDFYIATLIQFGADVAVFSSISSVTAGYIAFLMSGRKKNKYKSKIELLDSLDIEYSVFWGLLITGLVSIPLVIYKVSIAILGGYSAVRVAEGDIPSAVTFVEYMFMPFCIMGILFCKPRSSKVIFYLVVLWSCLTTLTGDRTTGIGALTILLYMWMYSHEYASFKKKVRYMATIIVSSIGLSTFIQFAYAFRRKGEFLFTSFLDMILNTISELGGSVFPMFTMMNIVPTVENFLMGKGYIFSFMGGGHSFVYRY